LSSEDDQIIKVASDCGCEVPFIRPKELAQDGTSGIDPVLHAIRAIPDYDYVVLLQPTSPLRIVNDIDNCIEVCIDQGGPVCVAMTQSDKNPYSMFSIDSSGKIESILNQEISHREKELSQVYALNGAVYVASCDWLIKNKTFISDETIPYFMPPERSVDIDTNIDFLIAQFLLTKRNS
jgi:N-acylneuraminate cytidylyltransferase